MTQTLVREEVAKTYYNREGSAGEVPCADTSQPEPPTGVILPVYESLHPLSQAKMDLIPGAAYKVYGVDAIFLQIVLIGFYEEWAALFKRDDGTKVVVLASEARQAISPLTQKAKETTPLIQTYITKE